MDGSKRKRRADAERNRLRLLNVARVAFAERGMSASLQDIARTAGVGIGTLYRHFPTREMLVDDIYRDEGARLMVAARELATSHDPVEAVRAWISLFIHALETRQILSGVLDPSTSAGDDELCGVSGEVLVSALDGLLNRAIQSGDMVRRIEAFDLLCAVAGIATYRRKTSWDSSARHLVDILVLGLTRPETKKKARPRRSAGKARSRP